MADLELEQIDIPLRLEHDEDDGRYHLRATLTIDASDLDSRQLRAWLTKRAEPDASYKTFIDGPYLTPNGEPIVLACIRHSLNPEVSYCGRVPRPDEFLYCDLQAAHSADSHDAFQIWACDGCEMAAELLTAAEEEKCTLLDDIEAGRPDHRGDGLQAHLELARRAPRARLADVRPASYDTMKTTEQLKADVRCGIVARTIEPEQPQPEDHRRHLTREVGKSAWGKPYGTTLKTMVCTFSIVKTSDGKYFRCLAIAARGLGYTTSMGSHAMIRMATAYGFTGWDEEHPHSVPKDWTEWTDWQDHQAITHLRQPLARDEIEAIDPSTT